MENSGGTRPGERTPYGPSPRRTPARALGLSRPRAAVYELLAGQREPCTVGALAAALHQHPNTVREHLDGLVGSGLAVRTRAPSRGRGRPAWLYAAAPGHSEPPGTREYAGLAIALAEHISATSDDPARDAMSAGRRWGRQLVRRTGQSPARGTAGAKGRPRSNMAARRELVTMLGQLGFDPETDRRATVVRLRACPLLQAVYEQPEVVCAVHLGLTRGALEELGTDGEAATLTPFAERGACLLELLPPMAEADGQGRP